MAELIPAPDGAPVTPPPASQQPGDGQPKPDGNGTKDAAYYQAEAKKAFEARDAAKAASSAAKAQHDAMAKQIVDLQGRPQVSPEDLDLLNTVKAERAEAARTKALKAGDADAIAASARKPLEEQVSQLNQVVEGRNAQLTALLRDKSLEAAIKSSQLQPIDADVVADALRHRIAMSEVGGQFVPVFTGVDGQPLFNAQGKVTDTQVFVDDYLGKHPGLCKANAKPGSGAPQPGGGSTTPAQAGQKPKSVAEWNAMTAEQQEAANMQPGELSALAFAKPAGDGLFGQ